MILKLFILVTLCFIITHGDSKEDLKKIKDTLSQGGKVKQHSVNVVTERGHTDKAETPKAGQKASGTGKAATGKKTDKDLKKKVSGTVGDGKDKASDGAKSSKKKGEKYSQEKESAKHAASDTSDNIKSTVAETESKSEKDSEGFVGRLFQMFSSVKTSLLEPVGLASNTPADTTDQEKAKTEDVSDTAKKASGKAKKKGKETADL